MAKNIHHLRRRVILGSNGSLDLAPAVWTKVKIEVAGIKARLYVHGAEQPALVVNDLKLGISKGAIGLMIGPGTVAHFTNLSVSQERAGDSSPR